MEKKCLLGILGLVVFLSLVSLGFVGADADCIFVDRFNETHYCDADLNLQLTLSNGVGCVEDFQCTNYSCIDGKCQSKYISVSENLNMLGQILNFINGIECDPEGPYTCDGTDCTYYCEEGNETAFLCGENAVWENKGFIDGECGYESSGWDDSVPEWSNPPSGGSSSNYISNSNFLAGYSVILREGQRIRFKIGSVTHYVGIHKLNSTQVTLKIASSPFYENLSEGDSTKVELTGDNYYDLKININSLTSTKVNLTLQSINESKTVTTVPSVPTTPYVPTQTSTGNAYVDHFCGDGTCDVDELSSTCPADCEAEPRQGLWIWVAIVICIFILAAIVGYLLYRKSKSNEILDQGKTSATFRGVPPMPPFRPTGAMPQRRMVVSPMK